MNTDNEIDHYHLGWAFFNTYGVKGGCFLPLETDNLVEWMKGFMAAQADYSLPQEYKSVEAALIDNEVHGALLIKLLQVADSVVASGERCILPNVPVRGRAKLKLVCNGFSLIELMVVIAIIGVVASIAMPSFGTMIESNKLKSAVQSLQDDVQFARTQAIKRSQNVALFLTRTSATAGDWCYGLSTKTTCNCTVTDTTAANYCEIKTVLGTGFSSVSASASTNVVFDFRRGTIPAALEVPFSTAHYQASDFITQVGRVTICTPSAITSGLTALPSLKC